MVVAGLRGRCCFTSPLFRQWGDGFGVYGLWGSGDHVYFPLLPGVVYPLAGMVYSARVLESKDRSNSGRRTVAIGAILSAMGAATFFLTGVGALAAGEYFRDGPGAQLAVVGFILLWLAACERLAKRWDGSSGLRLLCFWSRHVTTVYFLHWVLIGWTVLLLDRNRYASSTAVGVGVLRLFLTHVAVFSRVRLMRRRAVLYKLA